MPKPPLPEKARALLAGANPAVMACVRADGRPVTVATWYLLQDDGRILINLDAGRQRLKYLRADPRVSLTALAGQDWYTTVSVQGTVVDLTDDSDLAGIDQLSIHYTGHRYANRERPRVSGWIEIDHWAGWHL